MFTDRTEAIGPAGGAIPIEVKAKSLAELAADILQERNSNVALASEEGETQKGDKR